MKKIIKNFEKIHSPEMQKFTKYKYDSRNVYNLFSKAHYVNKVPLGFFFLDDNTIELKAKHNN